MASISLLNCMVYVLVIIMGHGIGMVVGGVVMLSLQTRINLAIILLLLGSLLLTFVTVVLLYFYFKKIRAPNNATNSNHRSQQDLNQSISTVNLTTTWQKPPETGGPPEYRNYAMTKI